MREDGAKPKHGRAILHELVEVLEVAADLATSLTNDPLLQRLIESFRLMPFEDRGVFVGAVEREVQARRLSGATESVTGQSMHPNRHARFYLRSHEAAGARRNLERDELMLSMLRGMRVTPLLVVPEVHESWLDGTREALEHLEPSARQVVIQLTRELLTLAEQAGSPSTADERTVQAS